MCYPEGWFVTTKSGPETTKGPVQNGEDVNLVSIVGACRKT